MKGKHNSSDKHRRVSVYMVHMVHSIQHFVGTKAISPTVLEGS